MKISIRIDGKYLIETSKDEYIITANSCLSLCMKSFWIRIKEMVK